MKKEIPHAKSPVKDSWPQNLLIWAQDVRFLEAHSSAWSACWGGEEGAVLLSAPELEPAGFEGEVRSLPMWRERQVVRLAHADRAPAKVLEALEDYLERPSPSTALLVEFTGDLGKKAPAGWKGIAGLVEVRDCGPKAAGPYIRGRAKAEGYVVSSDAAEALEEWACGDMGKLASALDLLFLYRTTEKKVAPEDLDRLLGAGGIPKMWDLQDAFLRGDRRAFTALLEGIERDREASALAFLGMLAKQVRGLLLYRGLKKRGKKDPEIGFKELGLGHPLPAQKLMKAATHWPEERVRSALGGLCDLDLALKSKHKDVDEWAVLEQGLLKIF